LSTRCFEPDSIALIKPLADEEGNVEDEKVIV
jgi:hypothetical protein